MGFDFRNDDGRTFEFSLFAWLTVLNLATTHGWVSEGTEAPASGPDVCRWSGEYTSNEGQGVRTTDAHNLAKALERALEDSEIAELVRAASVQMAEKLHAATGANIQPARRGGLTDGEKDVLRGFIEFCRAGSFAIW